ncbi:MAG: S8/S53 family peptidase [Phycisphaerae bacterium]|nr:S8/S53 family peptidase [Phycisphaerae bacterium]
MQKQRILYKLTTIDEFKQIAGEPLKETKSTIGGIEICELAYSDVFARFAKVKDKSIPFTILQLSGKGMSFDIGKNRQVTLRDTDDLGKIDPFLGVANMSLTKLDLRKHKKILDEMSFDTFTKWPKPNRMPKGFKPERLLEEGKNPGLGVRALHKQGIDGRGVVIAIIDQPLMKDHREYDGKITKYEGVVFQSTTSAMHGTPIVSAAVGEQCGVAPAARVYYYSVPLISLPDNGIYCDIIDKIIEENQNAGASEKVRVVNISSGTFRQQVNFDRWKETFAKAAANGILVVTCDTALLNYGTLDHITDRNADSPSAYKAGKSSGKDSIFLVPAGNRTTASHMAQDAYTFWRQGERSWAAPYLAGLAALAYQVDPEIKPGEIVNLWIDTAIKTNAGYVINPTGFIEAVQKTKPK